MMERTFRQLEIAWVDLEPTRGAETWKNRPCLILQASRVNAGSKTVIVAPILPGHKHWPFAVNVIPSPRNDIDKNRHINLKQLRVVDVSRIGKRQGTLENTYLKAIHTAMRLVFDIT